MKGDALVRVRGWLASEQRTVGFKLPPERELAPNLGLSRADLRKALLVLEAEGRLERRVGSGTYLRQVPRHDTNAPVSTDIDMLAERTGPLEAMNARLALEPELAQMAALQASPGQIAELRRLERAMRSAESWGVYEELDAGFHALIAKSAGNPLLFDLHRIVNGVRMIVVWKRLRLTDDAPQADYHSFAEHEAIVKALERRDRLGARAAMSAHLKSTIAVMTAEH